MTDQALDYEELLKRGRQLHMEINRQYPGWWRGWSLPQRLKISAALLERHLAQRVREQATAIICSKCQHMQEANIGGPCSYCDVVLPDPSNRWVRETYE